MTVEVVEDVVRDNVVPRRERGRSAGVREEDESLATVGGQCRPTDHRGGVVSEEGVVHDERSPGLWPQLDLLARGGAGEDVVCNPQAFRARPVAVALLHVADLPGIDPVTALRAEILVRREAQP